MKCWEIQWGTTSNHKRQRRDMIPGFNSALIILLSFCLSNILLRKHLFLWKHISGFLFKCVALGEGVIVGNLKELSTLASAFSSLNTIFHQHFSKSVELTTKNASYKNNFYRQIHRKLILLLDHFLYGCYRRGCPWF